MTSLGDQHHHYQKHHEQHLHPSSAVASRTASARQSPESDSLLKPSGERTRKRSVIDKILYTDTDIEDNDGCVVGASGGQTGDVNIELLSKVEQGATLHVKEEKREQWNSFMEYFLSIIGFVIDLGNVWR